MEVKLMTENMNLTLIDFLEKIDTELAKNLLQDLKDPEKRTPQLYNAIDKFLRRHDFHLQKLQPDNAILGELAGGLEDYKNLTAADGGLTEDEQVIIH